MDEQIVISGLIALNAIQFLVIGLLAFRLDKNVPPQVVEALFNIGRRETLKTEAKWDDEALEQVIQFYNDLKAKQEQS